MGQWQKKWIIQSESRPGIFYTVSIDAFGNYGCSCKAWTMHVPRKDCKHIREVKTGRYAFEKRNVPAIQRANINQVALMADGQGTLVVKVPTLPLVYDEHFIMTLIFDLLEVGVEWSTIIKAFQVSPSLEPYDINNYILLNGRKIYDPASLDSAKGCFTNFITVPYI